MPSLVRLCDDRSVSHARRQKTFVQTMTDAKSHPTAPVRPVPGRNRTGDRWVGLDGKVYSLVNDALTPGEAKHLAGMGANIVYDACGCGGAECQLDWLTTAEVRTLASAAPPTLHPSKDGLARLAEWRTDDGGVLIEAAVEISWGRRIPG
jgi:hypothetical protein